MNSIKRDVFIVVVPLLVLGLPALSRAQYTDRSELTQFLNDTANQGPRPAAGTRITMANWQQYKQFMPFGMVKLFEGQYQWKMPADVELDVGPTRYGNLPRTWIEATEKYGNQDAVEVLPNDHFKVNNYHGGVVFPNPSEPHKGFKILANVFFAHAPLSSAPALRTLPRFGLSTGSVIFPKILSILFTGRADGILTPAFRPTRITRPGPGTPNGLWKRPRSRPVIPPPSLSTTKTRRPIRYRIIMFSCRRYAVHCVCPLRRAARLCLAVNGPTTTRRSMDLMGEQQSLTQISSAIVNKLS